MKRFLSLILALTLLLCALAPAALARGTYLGSVQVVNCASWVTLREYASTSAPSVTRVPLYAWVEAYYYNSQFTECYYNGRHGYILSTYLSNGSSGSQSSASSSYLGKKTIVNCNEFVTLREYASTKAPTVTKIARGQQVDAYYYNGTFCECYYNGLRGFILSQYLGSGSSAGTYSGYASGEYMGTMRIVNCDAWVSLREYPSTDAPRIATVPLGALVEATWYNSRFAECEYRGMTGYILLSYLR